MDSISVDGRCTREPDFGQRDYLLILLPGDSLRDLESLIRRRAQTSLSYSVDVGGTPLRFERVSHTSFVVEASDEGGALFRADGESFLHLANMLNEMAGADSDPDYLVHMHLDTLFTSPPKGLTDVVIQRLDEYHPG